MLCMYSIAQTRRWDFFKEKNKATTKVFLGLFSLPKAVPDAAPRAPAAPPRELARARCVVLAPPLPSAMYTPQPILASQPTTSVIEIPNGPEVNFLIGQKGASINQIQMTTGAHIAVQKVDEVLPGATTRRVSISGDEHQRGSAVNMVLAKVSEYQNTMAAAPSRPPAVGEGGEEASIVIQIPNGPEVNFLIGQKGATVNMIQVQTGTHIAIQRPHEVSVGAITRDVTVSGGVDEVARARSVELIKAKVAEYRATFAASNASSNSPDNAPGNDPGNASNIGSNIGSNHGSNEAVAADPAESQAEASPASAPPAALTAPAGPLTARAGPLTIDVPNGPEINFLIGQRGVSINAIQQSTGTHVAIQRPHEVPIGASTRQVRRKTKSSPPFPCGATSACLCISPPPFCVSLDR